MRLLIEHDGWLYPCRMTQMHDGRIEVTISTEDNMGELVLVGAHPAAAILELGKFPQHLPTLRRERSPGWKPEPRRVVAPVDGHLRLVKS